LEDMPTTLSSRIGGGGIRKRSGGGRVARVDQDGDLDMDAPAKTGGRGGRGARRGGARSININGAPTGPAAERASGSGSGATRSRGTRPSGRSRGGTARKSSGRPEAPLIGVKVWGWKQSKGSAEECVRFLERKTNLKFKKVSC
jgi:nuclear RNA export factor